MILSFLILLLFAHLPAVQATTSIGAFNPPASYIQGESSCLFYRPVTLFLPTRVVRFFSCKESVEQILLELGEVPQNFEVAHDLFTENGRDIVVIGVTRTRKIVWQKLSFPIETTYTKSLPHRKKVIDKRGVSGLRGIITEDIAYENGTKKSKTIAKWIERRPLEEYVRVGTKYDLQQKVIDGKTINYWGTLLVKATSYDHSCYGCNDITATGAKLTKGIVAVDPKVIPMHTQMYIPGYGFGKAEDTGGMIKGNRIDLAYDDIRYGNWSKRWVTIYLID